MAFAPSLRAQDFTLQKAVQLALSHSTMTTAATADQVHAYQTFLEVRNSFIPQVTVGSGLAYAFGFPLSLEGSAPTIFNVTAQSYLLNFAQRDLVRAARAEWRASSLQTRDQRSQVMLDTALSYAELDKWERELRVLQDQNGVSQRVVVVVSERIKEGVDSPLDETKARLTNAQVRLRMAQAQGAADILRTHLAQLTGVPAQSITTVSESVPALPAPVDPPAAEAAGGTAVESNDAVQAAEERARAQLLNARAAHRQMWPSADLAAQYGLISTAFTNFEQFFVPHSFQNQNVTAGLVIRFPFLNFSGRAAARAADADAIRARKDVQAAKDQLSLDKLRLQRAVEQAAAAREVAELQSELANSNRNAVQARMQAATATLAEMQQAALDADERAAALMDAEFDLQHAQLQLLRATGELENWVFRRP
jgi:outer membrane protein TolC